MTVNVSRVSLNLSPAAGLVTPNVSPNVSVIPSPSQSYSEPLQLIGNSGVFPFLLSFLVTAWSMATISSKMTLDVKIYNKIRSGIV